MTKTDLLAMLKYATPDMDIHINFNGERLNIVDALFTSEEDSEDTQVLTLFAE